MSWTWRLVNAEGVSVKPSFEMPEFPSQSDAESWLGEEWRTLAESGATGASLYEGDRLAYGPMSLLAE